MQFLIVFKFQAAAVFKKHRFFLLFVKHAALRTFSKKLNAPDLSFRYLLFRVESTSKTRLAEREYGKCEAGTVVEQCTDDIMSQQWTVMKRWG